MRIDAPIITGSFSLNGSILQNLSAVSTTGSNTFVGNQNVQGYVSASALTGSIDFTNLTNSPTLVSGSSQVVNILSSLNTATASFTPRITNLESKSSSVDISISNINSFTASNGNESLNSKTGSYATTGSNTFFGTQTYSGSVYIANDLIVQGSSSIQYISASSVSIGTNIVQLNTANPSVRFAGLTIIDSGSIGGSGSFLYDSVHDEFVFVHRGNGTNVTSSHFVLGPETYDSLGNETYLTTNILSKGTGKEHLIDSCIFDNGTTTCIKNNLVGTGTITGTTIYGSTAVCSPVGKFTSCIDAGSATFSNSLTVDYAAVDVDLNVKNTQSAGAANLYLRANANGTADLRFTRNSDSSIQGRISYSFTDGSMNFRTGGNDNKLLISSTGAATFGNSLGVSGATSTNGVLEVLKASSSIAQFSLGWNVSNHTDMYVDATGNFYIQPQGTTRLTISSTGAATFACSVGVGGILQVKSTSSTPSIWSGQYGGAISILGDNSTSNRYIDLSIVDSTGALATQGLRLTSGGTILIGSISNSSGNPTFYIQNKAGLVANIAGFNFSSTTTAENANNNILASGAYYNGAATTATQTSATLYQQSSGTHTFYTNNGLTAGNNYTATERMTITSGGNLLATGGRISNARCSGGWQEWVAKGVTLTNNSALALFCINGQYDNLIVELAAWVDQGAWSAVSYKYNVGYNAGSSYTAILGPASSICGITAGTTYNETWCWKNCSGGNINNSAIVLRIFGMNVQNSVSNGGADLIISNYLTRVS